MRRGPFDVLAGISLILTLVLALGFTSSFGVNWTRVRGSAPTIQTSSPSLRVDRGRIVLLLDFWHPATLAVLQPAGLRWHGRLLPSQPPDLRRSVWEFDAHWLGAATFILACPIWCVAAPLLVVPWYWWRSRRKLKSPAGFEVLGGPTDQGETSLGLKEG